MRKKSEPAVCRNAGVELSQRTCGGIARINERSFIFFVLLPVKLLEIRLQHQHFASHFEKGRSMSSATTAFQCQGNGTNGSQIQGDILTHITIAPSCTRREYTIFIAEAYGKPVKLGLDRIFHAAETQRLAHASVECFHLNL